VATYAAFNRNFAHGPTAATVAILLSGPAWSQTVVADADSVQKIVVQAQHQTPEIGHASVNEFTAAPMSETPVSAGLISAEQLLDRGVNSLSSAIRADTSAGDDYNTFGYVESAQIRGFKLDPLLNFRRDGLPVTNHVPIALENKEAIELFKGLPGALGADAAPGGLVNYVLKRPTEADLRSIRAELSERGSHLVAADFGGRWDDARFGYRVNAAAEDRHPAIDNAWSRRVFGSGSFDWRIATGSLLELEFEYQGVQEISVPGYGLLDTTGSGVATVLPPPIDPRINLNSQPWTQPFQSREAAGSLRWTQRLGAAWDLGLRLAQQRSVANDRLAFPDGCSQWTLQVPPGQYVYPGLCRITGRDFIDVYQYISDDEKRNTRVVDAYLHGTATIGGLAHELRFGWRSTRYDERYPPYQAYNFVGTIDILAPVPLPASPAARTPNSDLDLHLDELSAFDVVRYGPWSAWLALRASRLTQDSHLDAADVAGSHEATALRQSFATPFASLAYMPCAGCLLYVSGGEGVQFEQVPNRPNLFSNSGQALPALRSRQGELGFKRAGPGDEGFSAALFQIDKPFSDDQPPDGSGRSLRVAGARHARHRGLELSGSWRPVRQWHMESSVTWLDAVTTAALNPAWVGRSTTNVPHLSALLRAGWQPAQVSGLTLGTQVTYAGHKAVLPTGAADLPDAWQWDASVQYRLRRSSSTWIWRAGIDNLTDRSYWREAPTAAWGAQYLFPAAPRTARAGLQLLF
jgi:iron complex outermembrane receptor protein